MSEVDQTPGEARIGKLSIQDKTAGPDVLVNEGIKFEDHGAIISTENLSIEEAFDFLIDQSEDA